MILNEEVKNKIREEYENWFEGQYGNTTKEERKRLGAVYTPPDITIKMIEMFNCEDLKNKKILDPSCGSGNLLTACIIAGATPEMVYGNEVQEEMVDLCRRRLAKYGVPKNNIHRGDATDEYCLSVFGDEYEWPKKVFSLWQ